MEKLTEIGKNMELEGQNLLNFVKEQQKIQIQERTAERKAAKGVGDFRSNLNCQLG